MKETRGGGHMDRLGFIHEEIEIKMLILFVLRRLPGVVDPPTLQALVMCDDGIDYFDYSDCLSELVEGGNVEERDGGYIITDKGARNVDQVESSLPYSVRTKAARLLTPLQEKMRRDASIVARHESDGEGCSVILGMGDGKGELISLRFLCADEEQAKKIETNFRRDAEAYYQRIVEMLSED